MTLGQFKPALKFDPSEAPQESVVSFDIRLFLEYGEQIETHEEYNPELNGYWGWAIYGVKADGTSEHLADRRTRREAYSLYHRMLDTNLPLNVYGPEVDPLDK
ncbi:hypothetical protein F7U66_11005 [Vibrio parahaemolyticus]|nr:hypothetical protein [Vibrio parahaemolyticus]